MGTYHMVPLGSRSDARIWARGLEAYANSARVERDQQQPTYSKYRSGTAIIQPSQCKMGTYSHLVRTHYRAKPTHALHALHRGLEHIYEGSAYLKDINCLESDMVKRFLGNVEMGALRPWPKTIGNHFDDADELQDENGRGF